MISKLNQKSTVIFVLLMYTRKLLKILIEEILVYFEKYNLKSNISACNKCTVLLSLVVVKLKLG